VAGVTFLARTISATWPSRSSAIGAMPTFVEAGACVSASKSVVFPEPGRPTMPISSATAAG